MKFFKDFFQFRKSNMILEQTVKTDKKDQTVGGKDEFEVKASKAGKNKLKLDYTKKATEPYWQGSNYETEWKPWVNDAMGDAETRDKIIKYLDEYKGQDNQTVKAILKRERDAEAKGKGSLNFAIQKLATDGKIGPFHTIIKQAITKVTGKDIDKLDIKPAPEFKPNDTTPGPKPVVIPTDVPQTSEVISKKMIINVIDRETKKPILTAKYILKDEDGEVLSSGQVDKNAEFSFIIIGPSKMSINISADGYETFDKKFSFDEDEFSSLTAKEDVVRKTVSLVPIKKVEPEKPKEEPKEEVEQKIDFDDGPKSETSDQATGRLGEAEKQQINYKLQGAKVSDKLLTLNYPLTDSKTTKLGNYVLGGDFENGKETDVTIRVDKKITGDKWIYFINNDDSYKEYPLEFYKLKMGEGENEKTIPITPQKPGKLTMKMIISTLDIKVTVTTVRDGDYKKLYLTQDQSEKFLKDLVKSIKPFSETQFNGPVFSTVTREFDVKPKSE